MKDEKILIDFDLKEFFAFLYKKKKKLIIAIAIGAFLGGIISISIPKSYSTIVILSPELNSNQNTTNFSNLANSILGSNSLQENSDALRINMASEIVESTPFLIELYQTQIKISKTKYFTNLSQYLLTEKKPWWNYIINFPSIINNLISKNKKNNLRDKPDSYQLTGEELNIINQLKQKIKAEVDKKKGFITIEVNLQDPEICAYIATKSVDLLQKYLTNYRITKAKEDYIYIEKLYNESKIEYASKQSDFAKFIDKNKNIILQSKATEEERLRNEMNLALQLYTQLSQKLQIAKAKIQEEKPAFTILEPARIPLNSSYPNKKLIILACSLLSLTSSILSIIIKSKFYNNKFQNNYDNN